MDNLFPEKLALLHLYYPEYLEIALAELLRGCNGDLDATRALVEGPKPIKRLGLHQGVLGRNVKAKTAATKGEQPGANKTPVPARVSPVAKASLLAPTLAPATTRNAGSTRSKSEIITLNTPEDVETHLGRYALLHQNFFAKEMAGKLLDDVLAQRHRYTCHEFHLFGNQCMLNHGFAAFCKPGAEYPDLIYNGLKTRRPVPYSPVFSEAANLVDEYVNTVVIPTNERLPFQTKQKWSGTYCAVNFYEKLSNNLDWHSDRLSHIGPHSYIASVSLGSTRVFRLRSNRVKNAPIYQIPLTHNSLLIMKAGCQEEYKHCVNAMGKPLELHPKIGTMRFGLTFRHYDHEFLQHVPKCKCDMNMTLRRSYKTPATRGRYFWLCENIYQNKECDTFHWADFDNAMGNYVSESPDKASTWIADDDNRE